MEDIKDQAWQLWDWQHGGTSFYCALYFLFQKADSLNQAKLAVAFPKHWQAFREWEMSADYGNEFFKFYGIGQPSEKAL